MRFKACYYCHSAKLSKFPHRKMFSPKWDKAASEQNHQKINLNGDNSNSEQKTFFLQLFSLYGNNASHHTFDTVHCTEWC